MKRATHLSRKQAIATACAATLVLAGTAACSSGSSTAASGGCTETVQPEDVTIYLGVGSFSSTYWQEFLKGADAVRSSLDLPEDSVKSYQSEFDGQKLLDTFTGVLASGGAGTAIVADPASTAYTKPLVSLARQSDARIVTLWNRPEDVQPWNYGGGCWVAHQQFDGIESGKKSAEALFDSFGGKGNIVALNGIPDNPSAKGRIEGLKQALAEHPDVKLLDSQVADWDQSKGQQITETWIGKYGDDIDGVWAANDGMALGAVEALKSEGLNGDIKVTGSDGSADALQSIQRGDMLTSMRIDGYVQGAVTFALAYASLVGDIDVESLTEEQRDFYLKQELATPENVEEILATGFDPSDYTYADLKDDFWADSTGQVVNLK